MRNIYIYIYIYILSVLDHYVGLALKGLRRQSMLECFLIKYLLYPDNCSKKIENQFVCIFSGKYIMFDEVEIIQY